MSEAELKRPDGDESVEAGVWRYAHAARVGVIVDAENYFAHMQQAMLNAQRQIMLIGWDFDTRIHLTHGRRWYHRPFNADYPSRLGSFLLWLARNRKELEVNVLKWGLSFIQLLTRGSMTLDIMRMWPKRQLNFKFDTKHPIGCSHHQKIAVLDRKLAVCGGIDMTNDRWDTRSHREEDPRRRQPGGSPYGPWHDITVMMEGDVAVALSDLCQARWVRAGAEPLVEFDPPEESPWPEKLEVDFENVEIGIARTRAEYEGVCAVNEIEELALKHIKCAKRFIYIENQYFTSRKIAEAIAERLREEDPPEIVIVHPETAEGWLEQQAMDHARACLARMLQEVDHKDRFHLFVPYSGETPIYVHAKLTIVDDEILRIGSANLNNRSMGLDSESDIFIDCRRDANMGKGHEDAIKALRHSLIAEHCGIDEDAIGDILDNAKSMTEVIEEFGRRHGRQLRRFQIPELNEVEETLAGSQLLDPERPDDMFEPFASGGLFRKGSLLDRVRKRVKRKEGK